MLESAELEELLEIIQQQVIMANRTGTLDSLLEKMGMSDCFKQQEQFESYKNGKIVVIAGSNVKESTLKSIVAKAGIEKTRLECCLDYDEAVRFNYKKLQYSPLYRVVMFGAIPHKTSGTGNSRSVISELETSGGYPRVIRLMAGEELKLTKSNFKNAISQLCEEGYVSTNTSAS